MSEEFNRLENLLQNKKEAEARLNRLNKEIVFEKQLEENPNLSKLLAYSTFLVICCVLTPTVVGIIISGVSSTDTGQGFLIGILSSASIALGFYLNSWFTEIKAGIVAELNFLRVQKELAEYTADAEWKTDLKKQTAEMRLQKEVEKKK